MQPVSDPQHWDQGEELLKDAVKDLLAAGFPSNIPEVLALLSVEQFKNEEELEWASQGFVALVSF